MGVPPVVEGLRKNKSFAHHRGQSAVVCPQDLVLRSDTNKRKRSSWDGAHVVGYISSFPRKLLCWAFYYSFLCIVIISSLSRPSRSIHNFFLSSSMDLTMQRIGILYLFKPSPELQPTSFRRANATIVYRNPW